MADCKMPYLGSTLWGADEAPKECRGALVQERAQEVNRLHKVLVMLGYTFSLLVGAMPSRAVPAASASLQSNP
jgi:hypothetical protein